MGKEPTAIQKLDYIFKALAKESGYDLEQAQEYAQQLGKDIDDFYAMLSGDRECDTGDTIPI